MQRIQLSELLKNKYGYEESQYLFYVIDEIKAELLRGNVVLIDGLGEFSTYVIQGRDVTNPFTLETTWEGDRLDVLFTPSLEFQDKLFERSKEKYK